MLTICRTLMGDPELVMIDEPTEGLSPMMVEHVGRLLEEIARRGVAILLIEQKLTIVLRIAHRVYVMGHGISQRPRTFAKNGWKCERELRALHASIWADPVFNILARQGDPGR